VILVRTIAAALMTIIVLSSAAKAGPAIIGEGYTSCGSWTEAREQKLAYLITTKRQWMLGFPSALNATGVLSKDFLTDNADADGIYRAMGQVLP
jgi:hypothetical protein